MPIKPLIVAHRPEGIDSWQSSSSHPSSSGFTNPASSRYAPSEHPLPPPLDGRSQSGVKILAIPVGTPSIRGTLRMLRENPERREVILYGIDADPHPFSRALFDHFFQVPPLHSPDYFPTVLALCAREKIDLILFHHDEELRLYSRRRSAFDEIGTRLLAADPEVVEVAVDKSQLYAALQGEGIPLPKHQLVTAENCEEAALSLGYPDRELIVKPPNLWGASGVYRITEKPLLWDQRLQLPMATLSQLKASLDRPILMMEALPGPEYSVDAFLGAKGAVAIPRRRNRITGGVALRTTLEDHPEIAALTLKAGRALGLRYVYGMQFRCDESGSPKLLECNPRIQGTSVASWGSGLNLIWMAVQEALGEPPANIPLPIHGATYARNWAGIVTTESRSWEV